MVQHHFLRSRQMKAVDVPCNASDLTVSARATAFRVANAIYGIEARIGEATLLARARSSPIDLSVEGLLRGRKTLADGVGFALRTSGAKEAPRTAPHFLSRQPAQLRSA